MDDLHLYERVAEELKRQGPHPGLWAKAFADSNGDKARAEALYLRFRVAQLAAIERANADAERKGREELGRAVFEREEMERRARAKAEGLTPIHWLLIALMTSFIVLLLLRALSDA
jgi:hypothetical protein